MTKHTPNPWESKDEWGNNIVGNGKVIASTVNQCNANKKQKEIGVLGMDAMEEIQANARLIAAAPEMLEELKRQRDWLHHIKARIDGIPESVMLGFQQADKTLSKVIAKAEGKA